MARKPGALFAKLDLDYADHPKIATLSDAAFRAHVEMILYARKYLTDGRIPNRVANRLGFDAVTELCSNSPDAPSLTRGDDGDYWLHDYADHQETKAEVEARRLVNADNGRRGGRPATRSAKRTETQSVTESVSDWGSENKAETETETETDCISRASAQPKQPPTKNGTRLDPDWQPSRTPGNLAAEDGHTPEWLRDQLDRFRDHWTAKTGRDATKRDWDATWRNWLRNATDWGHGRNGHASDTHEPPAVAPMPYFDPDEDAAWVAEQQRLIAEREALNAQAAHA